MPFAAVGPGATVLGFIRGGVVPFLLLYHISSRFAIPFGIFSTLLNIGVRVQMRENTAFANAERRRLKNEKTEKGNRRSFRKPYYIRKAHITCAFLCFVIIKRSESELARVSERRLLREHFGEDRNRRSAPKAQP